MTTTELDDLRTGLPNRMDWNGITPKMKTQVSLCIDCKKYTTKPIPVEEDRYYACPHCGSDWIVWPWVNLESRNFYDHETGETLDLIDLEYDLNTNAETFADDEIYTVDDLITAITDMGGTCSEIDMDDLIETIRKEKTIDHRDDPVVE